MPLYALLFLPEIARFCRIDELLLLVILVLHLTFIL